VKFGGNGLVLEGRLHYPQGRAPSAVVVICHPHPQRGGDMHNSVVSTIVNGVTGAGAIAFTFNFRGVGESQGSFDDGAGEQDDVRAALSYARSLPNVEQVALAGYSFGAGMAANVVDSSIPRLGLIALPTRQLQAPGLSGYDGPVLFATGSNDSVSSLEAIETVASARGENATVLAAQGADHFWWGQEEQLAEAVRDFFNALVPQGDVLPPRV
jgi:alpha/beta superfamily hydrolase